MKTKFDFRESLSAPWENLAVTGQILPGGRRDFSAAPREKPVFSGLFNNFQKTPDVAQPLLKGGRE